MWSIYKANIARKTASGQLNTDDFTIASIIADEYENALRLGGGDTVNGFPIANGNKSALILGIKNALEKGRNSGVENFNLIEELPPALTAYWTGATLSPYPNPLIKPLGYAQVIPPPGTIKAIGPDPIGLASSAARIAAEKVVLDKLVGDLKNKTISIQGIGNLNVHTTAKDVIDNKITDTKIKNHPAIISARLLMARLGETKIPTPNMTLSGGFVLPIPKPPGFKLRSEQITAAQEALKAQFKIAMEKIESDFKAKFQSPKLPSKEDLKKFEFIKSQTIKKFEIQLNYIPTTIPHIVFPPSPMMPFDYEPPEIPGQPKPNKNLRYIQPSKIMWCDPFINMAKQHLNSLIGMEVMLAMYPQPSPPAPAVVMWKGYTVKDGPEIPDTPIPILY